MGRSAGGGLAVPQWRVCACGVQGFGPVPGQVQSVPPEAARLRVVAAAGRPEPVGEGMVAAAVADNTNQADDHGRDQDDEPDNDDHDVLRRFTLLPTVNAAEPHCQHRRPTLITPALCMRHSPSRVTAISE